MIFLNYHKYEKNINIYIQKTTNSQFEAKRICFQIVNKSLGY